MVREPVGFLASLHQLFHYHLDEDEASLVAALDLEPERRAGRRLPRTVRIPQLLHYSELIAFAEQIERFRSTFGRERVHVIVQDDMTADTAAVYHGLLDFLSLPHDAQPRTFERVNAAHAPRSRWVAQFLQSRHPSLFEAYRRPDFPAGPRVPVRSLLPGLPLRIQAPLFRVLTRLNTRPAPRAPLPAEVRAALQERVRSEVERLSAALDRDLIALWGYDAESKRSSTPSR